MRVIMKQIMSKSKHIMIKIIRGIIEMINNEKMKQCILDFRQEVNFNRIRELVMACAQMVYGNDLGRNPLEGIGKLTNEI